MKFAWEPVGEDESDLCGGDSTDYVCVDLSGWKRTEKARAKFAAFVKILSRLPKNEPLRVALGQTSGVVYEIGNGEVEDNAFSATICWSTSGAVTGGCSASELLTVLRKRIGTLKNVAYTDFWFAKKRGAIQNEFRVLEDDGGTIEVVHAKWDQPPTDEQTEQLTSELTVEDTLGFVFGEPTEFTVFLERTAVRT